MRLIGKKEISLPKYNDYIISWVMASVCLQRFFVTVAEMWKHFDIRVCIFYVYSGVLFFFGFCQKKNSNLVHGNTNPSLSIKLMCSWNSDAVSTKSGAGGWWSLCSFCSYWEERGLHATIQQRLIPGAEGTSSLRTWSAVNPMSLHKSHNRQVNRCICCS